MYIIKEKKYIPESLFLVGVWGEERAWSWGGSASVSYYVQSEKSATRGLNLSTTGHLIAPRFSVFFFKNGQNNTY